MMNVWCLKNTHLTWSTWIQISLLGIADSDMERNCRVFVHLYICTNKILRYLILSFPIDIYSVRQLDKNTYVG